MTAKDHETEKAEAPTSSEAVNTEVVSDDEHSAESVAQVNERKLPVGGSVAIGVVGLALLGAWLVGPAAGYAAQLENRAPAQLPQLTLESAINVETYEQIEAWAVDHVRVKPLAVNTVNDAVAAATKETGSSLVIQGARLSAGRLPELFSAEEFTARCKYPADIDASRAALRAIQAAADAGNKDVVITVVPSKARTIGFLLGDRSNNLMGCAINEDKVIAQLASEFPTLLKVVDPAKVLEYAPRDPYWSGDTHWTPMGGRALSEVILQKLLNTDARTAKQILLSRTMPANKLVRGDLYRLMGSEQTTPTTRIGIRPEFAIRVKGSPNGTGSRIFTWTSTNPIPTAPASMMILHDSMVNVPRLTGQFGNVVPLGFDVHWSQGDQISRLPVVETVVLEFVDRTFLAKLRAFPNIDDTVEDDDRMAAVLTYLLRTN